MIGKSIKLTRKATRILGYRLREQGLRTTLIWMVGRGVPKLTGVPMLRYSAITPQIYVGPQYRQRGKRLLQRLDILYGVNMRIEYDDASHDLALDHYCYLPTIDDAAPTVEHLDKGAAFIADAVAADGKVYIHCAGGIGRAPTMAAAYFISTGMTLDDAIALIMRTRPFITITPPQMIRLTEYEALITQRRHANQQTTEGV